MSTSAAAPPITLADAYVDRALVTNVLLVIGGAAVTGLAAQLYVPLWPVPVTGQTLAVILCGFILGPQRGALSMIVYAIAGLVGLPVFSDASSGWGVLMGPTGGYILGFIAAAWLTGWLATRQWDRVLLRGVVAAIAGSVTVFIIGLPWLAIYLAAVGAPHDVHSVLTAGLYPFIIGGLIKAVLCAGVLRFAWARTRRAQ